MTDTPTITRQAKAIVDALTGVGSAMCSAELHRLGYRNTWLEGIKAFTPGKSIVGPALTLQFMPLREDVYVDDEYGDPEEQLHRHVMYQAGAGDVVVVDARGKMDSGIFGEMMMIYLKGRGGLGVVIDGCVRDWPSIQQVDIGCWVKGVTPNYHTQRNLFPYAFNVPIACGECYVAPGDIIVADDDGAVVVPIAAVEALLERTRTHAEWEGFAREKLAQGADLRRYYPLSKEAEPEFKAWKRAQDKT